MHNYDERGTFKIYHSFVFSQANVQWRAGAVKVLLVQNVQAPVTVEFVVVYSDCVCVSVNVWSHTLCVVYL